MSEEPDLELMRLLNGESPPGDAERTRRLLAADPEVAARFAELERVWVGLDLAPPAPADERLLRGVQRRLAERGGEAAGGLWGLPPTLSRAAAAAILAAGIGFGAWVGGGVATEGEKTLVFEPSMAESYWTAVDQADVAAWGEYR